MNPFDQTPSTPPVSLDPPDALIQPAPRRGRMALVAMAAAGLMGLGLVGVSQFASADRPEIDPNAAAQPVATPDDESGDDTGDDAEPDEPAEPADDGDAPQVDGQIVIDDGDGDPIVIDLGDGTVDGQSFEEIAECIGLPAFGDFEFEPGEFPFEKLEGMLEEFPIEKLEGMLEEFPFEEFEGTFGDFEFGHHGGPGAFGVFGADGSHVTVLGPDGLTLIDLGDGDGSVTITQENGEVTIATDGAATVKQIDDMSGEFGLPDLESLDIEELPEDFPFDKFEKMLPHDFEGFEDFEQMLPPDFESQLPSDIQDCLDAAGNG